MHQRRSHNTITTSSCIKCLSSLNVTFLNQGLDTAIIERFIDVNLQRFKQKFEEKKDSLNPDERIETQAAIFQISLLLSLLQRSKSHG